MVRLWLTVSVLASVMVPVSPDWKTMVSPLLAAAICARRELLPLSFRLVTVSVAAWTPAVPRPNSATPSSHARSIPQRALHFKMVRKESRRRDEILKKKTKGRSRMESSRSDASETAQSDAQERRLRVQAVILDKAQGKFSKPHDYCRTGIAIQVW